MCLLLGVFFVVILMGYAVVLTVVAWDAPYRYCGPCITCGRAPVEYTISSDSLRIVTYILPCAACGRGKPFPDLNT